MGITDVQRSMRANAIGSSDAAAILGVSPYSSAWDVWAEKTGRLVSRTFAEEATELGDVNEQPLVQWMTRRRKMIGLQFDVLLEHPEIPFFRSNADGLGKEIESGQETEVGIEAKTAGLTGPVVGTWGDDEWTDEIPEHYFIQCQFQMMCGGMNRVYVPALIGGRGRKAYCVQRQERTIELMMPVLIRFWEHNIQKDIAPEQCAPSLETARYLRRPKGKRVPINSAIVMEWDSARAARLDAEKLEDYTKAKMLGALGDAEEGDLGNGQIVTYHKFSRRGFTVGPSTYRKAHLERKSHDSGS